MTDEELLEHVKVQKKEAAKHPEFYHYNTLDALLQILDSRAFRLSRLETLNDPIEANRVDLYDRKNKVYVACFCHEKETPPMWFIYPDFDHVYCRIPDETLSRMKIAFSPFMSRTQMDTVIASVKYYCPEFPDDSFIKSELSECIR